MNKPQHVFFYELTMLQAIYFLLRLIIILSNINEQKSMRIVINISYENRVEVTLLLTASDSAQKYAIDIEKRANCECEENRKCK